MKRLILYFASLLFLVILLLILNEKEDLPQDYYKLADGIYLEKVDYFSKYRLIKKVNDKNEVLNASISQINEFSDMFVCYTKATNQYVVISKDGNIQMFKDSATLKNQYEFEESSLLSPWQFIENYKMSDRLKTIREIVLISIVLFVVLILKEFLVKLRSNNLTLEL